MSDEAFDWDAFSDWEDEENCCNLCAVAEAHPLESEAAP